MKVRISKLMRPVLASAVLMGCASSFATISGDTPITAEQYQKLLGRGIAASWFKNKYSKDCEGPDLKDLRARGFDHVRYRVEAKVFKGEDFDVIEDYMFESINQGLIPVISWINHSAESSASASDKAEYIAWWEDLARRFKGQHLVAFNLFTEINDGTKIFRDGQYNPWMKEASAAIRAIDPERIIILSSPQKTQKYLYDIDPDIYTGDDYMMVEWHLYASGPKKDGGQKNWSGNGSAQDRANVTDPLDIGVQFTRDTGIECYFGAWMPMTNADAGKLSQAEVENFARFFMQETAARGIPSALNAVQHVYDDKNHKWFGNISSTGKSLNMPPIVDILVNEGEFYEGVDTDPALIGLGGDVNEAPAFDSSVIVKADATEDEAYSASIAGNASDPENDAMTFSSLNGPSWLTIAADGSLSGTPAESDVGANSWTVKVKAKGGADTATLNIEVLEVDDPDTNEVITVEAGADIVVDADETHTALVSLSATGTGPIVSYQWEANGVVVADTAAASIVLDEGVHTLVVSAEDADGNVESDQLTVAINEYIDPIDPDNEAPVFKKNTILSTKAKVGKSLSKDISKKAKDADGDDLTFSKVDGAGWLKVSAEGKLSGAPAASDKGNNVFTIEVSDGRGGSDTATVKVRVK